VRGRWVRSYLRCHVGLIEDDQCSISENNLLLRHFATREEKLFEISQVSFKRLVTLLHHSVEGRLEDVVLVCDIPALQKDG
jgi:hypothetical protein